MLFNQKTTKLKITTFLSTLVFLAEKTRGLFFFSVDNNLQFTGEYVVLKWQAPLSQHSRQFLGTFDI